MQYISTLAEIFIKKSAKEETNGLNMDDEEQELAEDATDDEYMVSD